MQLNQASNEFLSGYFSTHERGHKKVSSLLGGKRGSICGAFKSYLQLSVTASMRINSFYRLLVSSYAISMFPEGILLPVYAIFVQKIGGDILDAGGALGIFLVTRGVFTVIVHRLHWSSMQRIWLLVVGWIVWLTGIVLYLAISNIWTLLLAQILTAIGSAVADPLVEEEIARHSDKGAEEFEWGFFEGSNDVVSGIAALLSGVVVVAYGFTALIYLMIATATISFVLILYYASKVRKVQGATVKA